MAPSLGSRPPVSSRTLVLPSRSMIQPHVAARMGSKGSGDSVIPRPYPGSRVAGHPRCCHGTPDRPAGLNEGSLWLPAESTPSPKVLHGTATKRPLPRRSGVAAVAFSRASCQNRTGDLFITSETLYQLS